ncbi:MAG: hypothetical protein Q8P56_04250 [Candidatus Uhrbacteria bacterium]|nr:hypothetical protein [Candidatus Uhrbacteria bacterium]
MSIPSHYVRVVYFYPADYTTDQRYLDAVDPFVQDIRSWYREKTGKTFYARSVEVIRGQKNAEEYSIPTAWAPDGAAWANVYAELGIDCNANTSIVTLVFLARTLQHANGRTCAPIGTWYNPVYNGDVTVSEANFDAEIAGACPGVALENYWWDCNQATKRRAVAHELGHAFSLSHPDCSLTVDGRSYCDLTIMWSWWNLDAGFIDEPTAPEMSTLLASPWFH